MYIMYVMFFKKQKQIQNLQHEMQNLFEEVNIIRKTALDRQEKYTGNRYRTYNSAIKQIHKMYNCQTDWGVSIGSIIGLRASLIGGSGIEINESIPNSGREVAFCKELLKFNNLDSGGFLKTIEEFEKEGKGLLRLKLKNDYEWTWIDGKKEKKETGMVIVKYIPWISSDYKIESDPDVDEKAIKATYKNKDGKDVPIKEADFVYRRFRRNRGESGSDIGNINLTHSLFHRLIEAIISLEKALSDSRLNNHLFAAPKPVIECENAQQAKEMDTILNPSGKGFNLKTRQLLIINGQYRLVTPDKESVNALVKEIEQCRYIISFTTGIPVQFLGDPAAVRNKNVSENLMEGVNHAMQADRKTNSDIIQEVCEKSMRLVNGTRTEYNPDAISARIGELTAADWQRLINFWFPVSQDKAVSGETFLEQIPGLDVEKEKERLAVEKKEQKEESLENQKDFFDNSINSARAEKIEEEKSGRKKEENV